MQTEIALKNEPLQDNRHSRSPFFLHSSHGPVSTVNGYPWLCNIRMRKISCSAVAERNSIAFLKQYSHDKRTHWTQVSQTSLKPALFWLHNENDSAKNTKDPLTTTELAVASLLYPTPPRYTRCGQKHNCSAALLALIRQSRHLE